MSKLSLYQPTFGNKDIIKSFKKIKDGENLPDSGATQFFYSNSNNPSDVIYLNSGRKVNFFYVDHDEFIIEIRDQEPGWNFEVEKGIAKLTLFFKDNNTHVPMNFNFDLSKEEYRSSITILGKKKKFELSFLVMLYGGLVKDSTRIYKIPDRIVKIIKGL